MATLTGSAIGTQMTYDRKSIADIKQSQFYTTLIIDERTFWPLTRPEVCDLFMADRSPNSSPTELTDWTEMVHFNSCNDEMKDVVDVSFDGLAFL